MIIELYLLGCLVALPFTYGGIFGYFQGIFPEAAEAFYTRDLLLALLVGALLAALSWLGLVLLFIFTERLRYGVKFF